MIKYKIQYKNHIARIHVENKPECHLAITNVTSSAILDLINMYFGSSMTIIY